MNSVVGLVWQNNDGYMLFLLLEIVLSLRVVVADFGHLGDSEETTIGRVVTVAVRLLYYMRVNKRYGSDGLCTW